MKKNKFFSKDSLILIVAGVLLVFSLFLFLSSNKTLSKEVIPMRVVVDDKIGLSLNTSELDFGTLMPGQAITKKLNFSNGYSVPLSIRISLDDGNITQFIFGKNNLEIGANKNFTYDVSLILPNNISKGFYEGNLIIEFLK